MNEVWNLDPIYTGFDDPAFGEDMARLKALVQKVSEFVAQLPQTEPSAVCSAL